MVKIIGNTTATPNPRPDWAQTDSTKADYIKNKPTILTEEEIVQLIDDNLSDLGERVGTMEQSLADLTYNEIAYTDASISQSVAECGSTIDGITLSWSLNKAPVSQTAACASSVGTHSIGADVREYTFERSYSSDTTGDTFFTLTATDERGVAATKKLWLKFWNGVYYGAATEPAAYDSAFVLGLDKTLRDDKLPSFTVDAGAGEYIYYCIPVRIVNAYGECSFNVGGLDGGFSLWTGFKFTNANGYTESYYVYRSDNAGLGETAVTVS